MARARTRTWSELPARRRILVAVIGAVEIGLMLAAEIDIHRRPASEINGPKLRWRLIALINFAGPLSYFRWGRIRDR